MESKYPCLTGFLDYDLKVYVLPDLLRLCKEIRPDADGKQGCTVPTAMFAFAVLDLLGFLMRAEDEAKRSETGKNIKFTLSQEANLFPEDYQANSQLLIHLFRHGLVHQVFPKAAGIAKVPVNSSVPLIFYQKESGCPNLNVDQFVDDLINAVEVLVVRIKTGVDDALASRMNRRLGKLQEDALEQLNKLRKRGYSNKRFDQTPRSQRPFGSA